MNDQQNKIRKSEKKKLTKEGKVADDTPMGSANVAAQSAPLELGRSFWDNCQRHLPATNKRL